MVLHEITDLIRDNRTAVFRHEDDVVSEKVDRMGFSVVFHMCSLVRDRLGYEKDPVTKDKTKLKNRLRNGLKMIKTKETYVCIAV